MTAVRIGISANFFHADPERAVFRHKTLQFVEERMAHALWRAGAVPLMLPHLHDDAGHDAVLAAVDGLVLAGGADVSPTSYGETALKEAWRGDAVRDAYECALIHRAIDRGVPVLGICRGIQVLNVALGGTLWQDLGTQLEGALVHRDWQRYDQTGHAIRLDPTSWVAGCYGGVDTLAVNSVHHQGLRALAPRLRATAWASDGVVEAAELVGGGFAVGVQWHPEWLEAARVRDDPDAAGWADGAAIFRAFVDACASRARRDG